MDNARDLAYTILNRYFHTRSIDVARAGSFPPGRGEAGETSGRRLATELTFGVIRHLTHLDWLLERAAKRPLSRISPQALTILRLGAFQIIHTSSIPSYAAVSESVELAKRHIPKASGFVNWVLRRIGPEAGRMPPEDLFRDDAARLSVFYSFPEWLVRRWMRRFGADGTEKLLAAMNSYPPLSLRANLARTSREELAEEFRQAGGEVRYGRYAPGALHLAMAGLATSHPAFAGGRFIIQDESSQLAALALAPVKGDKILDGCAGVGGKSMHLAELTVDGAAITAVDRDGRRLEKLRENADRLGFSSLTALQGDLLHLPLVEEGLFDKILIDAPCSSLGIIRRHPEIKWSKKASDPLRLAALQLKILERASALLKPQGRLVYSTCSTEPEEGEDVIARFLEKHREFSILPVEQGPIAHLEEIRTPEGFIRTFPHIHTINGVFVALLQRKKGS